MTRHFRFSILSAVLLSLLAASFAAADSGEEAVAHKLELYPQSVAAHKDGDSPDYSRLTRDNIEKVKSFYTKKKLATDKIEPFADDDARGFHLVQVSRIGKRDVRLMLLKVSETINNRPVADALGQLKGQVALGNRTEAEFKKMEKKYKALVRASFRTAAGPDGRSGDEGQIIFSRYKKTVEADMKPAVQEAMGKRDPAQDKETRRKIRELKAKGDLAGAVELAQQSHAKAGYDPAKAIQASKRDYWDTWVKCLDEMSAAAYFTRLNYRSDTLTP